MQKPKGDYHIKVPSINKEDYKAPVRIPVGGSAPKEKPLKGKGTKKEKEFKGKTNFGGLWENDLNKMSKAIPNYLGTYARDELKEVHPPKKESWGLIMNLSNRDQEGTHWVSIMNNVKDKYAAYYDSLMDSKGHQEGKNPPPDIMEQIKRLIKESNLDYVPKFKWNTHPDQYSNTQTCGFHAMTVLLDTLSREKSWPEATGFLNIKDGEKHIEKVANKFGYIL